jgi:acetyltransferase-like isoleucine patch superfamily enzyme
MGELCRIDQAVTIRNAGKIRLGDRVWLKEGVILDGRSESTCGILIGSGVTIRAYTYVDTYNGFVRIGAGSQVAQHVYIGGNGGVTIGCNVMIAANSCITSVAHGTDPANSTPYVFQPERRNPVVIEDNVWIAANSTIIDGVTVGTGSVVGAGSVVTADVPPQVLVAGNPARVVRSLSTPSWRLRAGRC